MCLWPIIRRPRLAELPIRVTPKSSKNEVKPGQPLKVFVTAPPVDGEANKAVIDVVSKALGMAKSRVTVVRGTKGRDKVLSIQGLSETELATKLASIT